MNSPSAHFCPSALIHSGWLALAYLRTSSLRLSAAVPARVNTTTFVGS